jgi:divalent metal cation (Fe/Co/Zn/Cd) transporter
MDGSRRPPYPPWVTRPIPDRSILVRRAVALEGFTLGYNVLELVVALIAGIAAGSVALVGFGLDSGIEILAAAVVLHRFLAEARHGSLSHSDAEVRTERLVGGTLIALAAYVVYSSVEDLLRARPPHESLLGIVLAALSLAVMPALAWAKIRLARLLGSPALAADAKETLACAYLSLTLLVGLVLNAALGWWWADPAAALAMVPFILREGIEAWRGDEEESGE